MREDEQPEQSSLPTTPASLPQPNLGSTNALMTGQVCRYVSASASLLAAVQRLVVNPHESMLTTTIVTVEPRKHLCGGDPLLEKLFAMLVVCTRRRETSHAQLISSATPQGNPFFPSTKAQHQAKDMTGALRQELQVSHRGQQLTSHQIIKPLEPVLEAVDVTAWAASKAAADVQLSTIAFPRQLSLR